MRIVTYSRVSTTEQATEGVSLAAQADKLRTFASLHELNVVAELQDAGASAKTLDRPGLQEALRLLRTGQADGVAVVKLDRLTRSVADWQSLIDQYFSERAGRQLMSVSDSIDTRTAAGRLVLNVLLSVAQWEREATAERTRDALRHKRRRNERTGGIPFGYNLASDGVSLVENIEEQAALAVIVDLRERRASLREIAAALNARGVRAKNGRPWQHTSVDRILRRAADLAATA